MGRGLSIGGKCVGAFDGPSSTNLPACMRTSATRKRLGCDDARRLAFDEVTTQSATAAAEQVIAFMMERLSEKHMADFDDLIAPPAQDDAPPDMGAGAVSPGGGPGNADRSDQAVRAGNLASFIGVNNPDGADPGATDDVLGDFRAYLKQLGLSDEDVEKACKLAMPSIDTATDGGRLRGAMDTKRALAMFPQVRRQKAQEERRAMDAMFPHADRLHKSVEGWGESSLGRHVKVRPRTAAEQRAEDDMFPNYGRLK